MDNYLVKSFKLVGSAAGILSVALLVYDRLVGNRPQAYLAKDGRDVDVVVKNVATRRSS